MWHLIEKCVEAMFGLGYDKKEGIDGHKEKIVCKGELDNGRVMSEWSKEEVGMVGLWPVVVVLDRKVGKEEERRDDGTLTRFLWAKCLSGHFPRSVWPPIIFA